MGTPEIDIERILADERATAERRIEEARVRGQSDEGMRVGMILADLHRLRRPLDHAVKYKYIAVDPDHQHTPESERNSQIGDNLNGVSRALYESGIGALMSVKYGSSEQEEVARVSGEETVEELRVIIQATGKPHIEARTREGEQSRFFCQTRVNYLYLEVFRTETGPSAILFAAKPEVIAAQAASPETVSNHP